jgi:hypothetical protein
MYIFMYAYSVFMYIYMYIHLCVFHVSSVGGMTGAVDKFEQYWRNRYGYRIIKETTDFVKPCCTYIHIYICTYICLYAYIYIYIYIHIYIIYINIYM